jgi:hypothetical protein
LIFNHIDRRRCPSVSHSGSVLCPTIFEKLQASIRLYHRIAMNLFCLNS